MNKNKLTTQNLEGILDLIYQNEKIVDINSLASYLNTTAPVAGKLVRGIVSLIRDNYVIHSESQFTEIAQLNSKTNNATAVIQYLKKNKLNITERKK